MVAIPLLLPLRGVLSPAVALQHADPEIMQPLLMNCARDGNLVRFAIGPVLPDQKS